MSQENKNIKLTPIQTDYKDLLGRTEVLHQSALFRLQQNRKEVVELEKEASSLEDMIASTKETLSALRQ